MKDPVLLYAGLGMVAFLTCVSVYAYVQPKQLGYAISEVRQDPSTQTAVELMIEAARSDAEQDAQEGVFTVSASFNPFFVSPAYMHSREYRAWMVEFERRLESMGASVEWRETDGSMCCSMDCVPSTPTTIDLKATYRGTYVRTSEWFFDHRYLRSKQMTRAEIVDAAKAAVGFDGLATIS